MKKIVINEKTFSQFSLVDLSAQELYEINGGASTAECIGYGVGFVIGGTIAFTMNILKEAIKF